jgi:hypothetical protein
MLLFRLAVLMHSQNPNKGKRDSKNNKIGKNASTSGGILPFLCFPERAKLADVARTDAFSLR